MLKQVQIRNPIIKIYKGNKQILNRRIFTQKGQIQIKKILYRQIEQQVMKSHTQSSLLKWATLLSNRDMRSIVDIQNTDNLVLLLNKLQPMQFQQLYHIDQRASNSIVSILKSINSYYKKKLHCNISPLIDGLNIFKTPIIMWQLLIGVAIKGQNRDTNINVILQMELQQQSQLMGFVQDVIQKINQYDIGDLNQSQISNSSDHSNRNRKQSNYTNFNHKRDQFLNQLIQENQTLKDKIIELNQQISQMKSIQQQVKKNYQQRLNHFKSQRYQFLQALTAGSSNIQSSMRGRKKSQFNFRQSIQSNQSKIFDDPLHDLNVSITGSLPQIATDLLNTIKNLKKQTNIHIEKSTLLEEHSKDLKLSINKLVSQNKLLKQQMQKAYKLQKQYDMVKKQNEQLTKNETQLLKMMNQLQQQKLYLREMVQKLKQQKSQLIKNNQLKAQPTVPNPKTQHAQKSHTNNTLGINSSLNSSQQINIMKAPSFILRHMSSQIQHQSYNLNQEIDNIKNPILKNQYQKEISQLKNKIQELKDKNNQLKKQNIQLKQINKLLQKTIHKSMEKTQQIQTNIQQGYHALFGLKSSIIQPQQNKIQKGEYKQKDSPTSPIQISLQNTGNVWIQGEQNRDQSKKDNNRKDNKQQDKNEINRNKEEQSDKQNRIVQFYQKMKKVVESYEQKQLLMMIEIESLKTQLNDVINQKQLSLNKQEINKNKEEKITCNNKQITEKVSKQFNINNNVITENKQSIKTNIQQQTKTNLNIYTQNINIPIPLNHNITQQQQEQSENKQQSEDNEQGQKKQQSVLMFNINISGPGGKNINEQHQQYQIRKSLINSGELKDKIVNQQYKRQQQGQNGQIKYKIGIQSNKRNRQIYPSQQFIQIEQGQELNQNQIPIIKNIKRSQNSVRQSLEYQSQPKQPMHNEHKQPIHAEQHTEQDHLVNSNNNNMLNLLNTQNRQMKMSTVSGVGQDTNNRRSYFNKSGFYNESFIQLSNKLQLEIQQDVNQITSIINNNTLKHNKNQSNQSKQYKPYTHIHSSHIQEQQQLQNYQLNQQQPILKSQSQLNQILINKLDKIKTSYSKIQLFHLKSSHQLESQLQSQSQLLQSQITQLKLHNQSLKHSLTKMLTQKLNTRQYIQSLKSIIYNLSNANNNSQTQQLNEKLRFIFNAIQELQHIVPQLQTSLQQSKIKQLQLLYHKQKYTNQRLQQQISILMETILYFRNLAIDQSQQLF